MLFSVSPPELRPGRRLVADAHGRIELAGPNSSRHRGQQQSTGKTSQRHRGSSESVKSMDPQTPGRTQAPPDCPTAYAASRLNATGHESSAAVEDGSRPPPAGAPEGCTEAQRK